LDLAAMIVSLNEVENLSLKACRGAGMSWGLAEEAAQAARWLAVRGLMWDRSLVALLAMRDEISPPSVSAGDMRPTEDGLALCPIHAGAAVVDLLRPGEGLTLHYVREPRWLVPFAHRRAGLVQTATLTWPDGMAEIGAGPGMDTPETSFPLADRLDWVRIELSAPRPPDSATASAGSRAGGTTVDPSAWASLEAWAARTYVAASLQSRMGGAGAGLSDND
jgi:hypothetical protein